MNVVDSCGWLEYFSEGPNAGFFAPAVERTSDLIVPSIILYEVFKSVLRQRDEYEALLVVAVTAQGGIVEFDMPTALGAARISLDAGLPMADSIILATARHHNALLWTQDAHFENLAGVRYIRKQ